MSEEKRQQGVQSVEVGMQLARHLALAGAPMSLSELASSAGMPPSKAHRYLVSLIRSGLVSQNPNTGRYDLGPLASDLGFAALARLDIAEVSAAYIEQARAQLDETLLLAVWGNRGPTVVRWVESTRPVTVNVRLGSVMPLLTSATGRAFLAWMPPAVTTRYVDGELALPTCPLQNRQEVETLIEQTRRHGLSRVQGEMLPGVSALAAPVLNRQDELVCVLTALGPQQAFDADWEGEVAAALREQAAALSARFGHRPAAGLADQESVVQAVKDRHNSAGR